MDKQVYVKVSFEGCDEGMQDMLTAFLDDMGYSGYEAHEGGLSAYIESSLYDKEQIVALSERLRIPFQEERLEHRNWNEEWEKNFQPVIIDGFCSVRADFHDKPDGVAYDIVITPKMSFGTGHHATTALMVTLMKDMRLAAKKVLDFGTGTGILAVLAEMLGAAYVLAIDNDEWSYLNAMENVERNGARAVEVRQQTIDGATIADGFDIVLANINRHVLLDHMDDMYNAMAPVGDLLLSGILPEDQEMIRSAAERSGFIFEKGQVSDRWACMLFHKGNGS